jgi:hypothetical protein
MADKIPSNPTKYPRWITLNGRRIIVNDHYHHSALTGEEYDADAKPVAKEPELQAKLASTKEESAEFFSRYGNVGDVKSMMKTPPTLPQLNAACMYTKYQSRRSDEEIEAARSFFLELTPSMQEPILAPTIDEDEITAEMLFGKKE